MTASSAFRFALSALAVCGSVSLLAACGTSGQVGRAQTAPGQMGTDISPARADLPIKNSKSTPVDRPE